MRKHNFTSDLRLGGSAAYNGAVAGLAATAQGMLPALQSVAAEIRSTCRRTASFEFGSAQSGKFR